jgi:Pyruvate/2-oxoacid:ferredoxin oxidoreductase delta subunit
VLPKLKTHQLTYYTGAVKVLYGYIPGLRKAEYHLHTGTDAETFSDLLLDLHSALPPTLAVMDAVVGMEGQGPSNGNPREIGLVLAGDSCPALDLVACSIIGFDPVAIPTVRKAGERGIGPKDLGDVEIFGERIDDVRVLDFEKPGTMRIARLPPFVLHAAQHLLAARPEIYPGKCISCGKCAEGCPPGAIRWAKGQVPSIRYRHCIRCYCCQELCPQGAVEVAYPWIRRVMGG